MREKFEPRLKIKEGEKGECSSVKKVIGSASEERKEKIIKEMRRRFNDQGSVWEEIPELKEKEIEKTPEEFEIIKLINNETNKLLFKFGLEKFDVSFNNIHLFGKRDYQGFFDSGLSQFFPHSQAIFIPKSKSKLKFMKRCIHEMNHFKSFQTFRARKQEPAERSRTGIFIETKSKKELFKHLNEAINEELTKGIFYNLMNQNSELLKKEIKETEKIKKEFLTRGNNKDNIDEIYFARTYSILIGREKEYKKEYKTEIEGFGYSKERKILNNLIEKIYLKNKDKFKNKEEVFDLFAKSVFTGKLDWGSLVNRTFGKGTFKKLAQLDKNVDELEKLVESL